MLSTQAGTYVWYTAGEWMSTAPAAACMSVDVHCACELALVISANLGKELTKPYGSQDIYMQVNTP